MNIILKDISPGHLLKAASFVKDALISWDGEAGLVASTEITDMGISTNLYLYAYTEGVLSLSYKETE